MPTGTIAQQQSPSTPTPIKNPPQQSSFAWVGRLLTPNPTNIPAKHEDDIELVVPPVDEPALPKTLASLDSDTPPQKSNLALILQSSIQMIPSQTWTILAMVTGMENLIPRKTVQQQQIKDEASHSPAKPGLKTSRRATLPETFTQPLPLEVQEAVMKKVSRELSHLQHNKELRTEEKITITQEKLELLKLSLSKVIDELVSNPSDFDKLSKSWGKASTGSKWLGGILVTGVPVAVAALSIQIPVLMAISLTLSGTSAIGYSLAGYYLNNHYPSTLQNEKLKTLNLSFADLFTCAIDNFNSIASDFTKEVSHLRRENAHYQSENERLSKNINSLCSNMDRITNNLMMKLLEQQCLKEEMETITASLTSLEKNAEGNHEQLAEGRRELATITETYGFITNKLSDYLLEAQQEKEKLNQEVSQLRVVGQHLQASATMLSNSCIQDEQSRAKFQTLLNQFLSDEEDSFATLTRQASEAGQKLMQTQSELDQTKEELKETQERLQGVLSRQEQLVMRLEQLERTKLQGIPYRMQAGRANIMEESSTVLFDGKRNVHGHC